MNMKMNMHIWRVHGKGRNYGGKELLLTYYFFGCFLGAKATRRKTEFGPWLDLALSWGRNVRPKNSVSGGLEYHLKTSFAHICLDARMDG